MGMTSLEIIIVSSMPDKMKIVGIRNEEDMKNIGIKIKLVR